MFEFNIKFLESGKLVYSLISNAKNIVNVSQNRLKFIILHPFGDIYAQKSHAATDHVSRDRAEFETHGARSGILFLEDRTVMVKLVVLLDKVVDIVGNQRRRIGPSGLFDYRREVGQTAYQRHLALAGNDRGEIGASQSGLVRLAEHTADTCVGVLYERAGIAVEVYRFLGIESHILTRVDLQQEIFQRSEPHGLRNLVDLLRGATVKLAQLGRHAAGRGHHLIHQVVGIDDSAFTALHLAFGKLHHTVAEMHEVFAPLESELVKEQRQHLEW